MAGTGPSYLALQRGQADALVLAQSYRPGQVWKCDACELMDPEHDRPATCPACGSAALKNLHVKENMVRLTGKTKNVAEVFTAMKKAGLAYQTLLQIRNKLLEAYDEIKQMSV